MRYQWLVDASPETYLYLWWQSASSVQRGHPARRRGLWPHRRVRVPADFLTRKTGPDKASHQMSSGWEIGFDAVPFTISWPSPWHIDGIYVSDTDSASHTKKGAVADEYNVHESDDKIVQEREKQNASLKITKLKKYKLGKVLMEESIEKGTHFIDLIKGWRYVVVVFSLIFVSRENWERKLKWTWSRFVQIVIRGHSLRVLLIRWINWWGEWSDEWSENKNKDNCKPFKDHNQNTKWLVHLWCILVILKGNN